MTWEIFLGIVALFGFITAVMTPIVKLNTSITKLNAALEILQGSMGRLEVDNSESHKRMWNHNEAQDNVIKNHEVRLASIENTMAMNEKLHGLLGVAPRPETVPLNSVSIDKE